MENSLLAIFDKIHPVLYIVQGVLSNFGAILKIHHQVAETMPKTLGQYVRCHHYVHVNTCTCK